MNMPTRSSEWIFNLMRYTGNYFTSIAHIIIWGVAGVIMERCRTYRTIQIAERTYNIYIYIYISKTCMYTYNYMWRVLWRD